MIARIVVMDVLLFNTWPQSCGDTFHMSVTVDGAMWCDLGWYAEPGQEVRQHDQVGVLPDVDGRHPRGGHAAAGFQRSSAVYCETEQWPCSHWWWTGLERRLSQNERLRRTSTVRQFVQWVLSPPRRLCNIRRLSLSVCLFVCLSLSNFSSQKLLIGFSWNFFAGDVFSDKEEMVKFRTSCASGTWSSDITPRIFMKLDWNVCGRILVQYESTRTWHQEQHSGMSSLYQELP